MTSRINFKEGRVFLQEREKLRNHISIFPPGSRCLIGCVGNWDQKMSQNVASSLDKSMAPCGAWNLFQPIYRPIWTSFIKMFQLLVSKVPIFKRSDPWLFNNMIIGWNGRILSLVSRESVQMCCVNSSATGLNACRYASRWQTLTQPSNLFLLISWWGQMLP